MKINLNHLYQFYVTAKEGSIKKASLILHVTEPTISKQIRDLEDFLDVQLFDRVNNQLRLTSLGKEIMEKAEPVFLAVEELENSIGKERSSIQNRIKFGVIPLIYPYAIDVFNMPFYEDHSAHAYFYTGNADELYDLLQKKKIDVAVADFPLSVSDFCSIKILDLKLICVGSKKFEHLIDRNVPEILGEAPVIQYSKKSKTQEDLNKFCEGHALNPEPIMVVECFETAKTAALQERGVAIVPESTVRHDLEAGNLVKLADFDFVSASVWMFVLNSRTREPLIRDAIVHATSLNEIKSR